MAAGTLIKSKEKLRQKCLTEVDEAKLSMVNSAVRIGLALLDAKEGLEGEFQSFVETDCGFTKSTAYRYMKAAEVFGRFPKLGHYQDSALYVLCGCEAAVAKSKELANRGVRITHELAKQLVEEAREAPAIDSTDSGVIDEPSDDGGDSYGPAIRSDESDDLGPSVPTHVVPTPKEPERKPAPAEPNVIGSYLHRLREIINELADEAPHIRLAVKESAAEIIEAIEC